MEHRDMHNTDLVWVTDRELQVTSLSARLRDLLFPSGVPSGLHVGELWQQDDPFGMMLVAHEWALEGEQLAFDTEREGRQFLIVLEPLYDLSGAITGVGGRATPGVGDGQSRWETTALAEVERLCGVGTWRTDRETGRTQWSAGLYEILGVDPACAPASLRAYDHPDDSAAIEAEIREGEIRGTGYRCEHRIVRPDGTVRYVQEQTHTVYDQEGTARAVVGNMLDITEWKNTEAQLAQLAHYDPVSNLPNRRLLEHRLQTSLLRAQTEETLCAVLFIDVDDFKRVNDTYGHARGDELLAQIGTRLNHYVRSGDTVARMSGDEFVVVLDRLTSHDDVLTAARKILRSFEAPFHLDGRIDCRVGVSIGVAIYPECSAAPAHLVDIADREMYVVKRNGGRGIKVACPASSVGRLPSRMAANA
ncbi:MAG TPA: diguanylate cyclase [Candidatus Baltobacteraceae bacterium]|nr:diguanylate cyclase [Candidatus Baltobacteraceae bacterium]